MTIKQQQLLLSFLGYYNGKIDGITGSQTQKAIFKFQEVYGLSADGIFGAKTEAKIREIIGNPEKEKKQETTTIVNTQVANKPTTGDAFWDGIKYFQKSEWACKCGCGLNNVDHTLVTVAERVRTYFNTPITISSGLRCPTRNAQAGGVSNSRHLTGKAMDFCVRGKSAAQVLTYVQKQPEIRYSYAINDSYVHMDVN
jgi:peptidoglycan hydrolase-like protein with peptidoglycan-binding domain